MIRLRGSSRSRGALRRFVALASLALFAACSGAVDDPTGPGVPPPAPPPPPPPAGSDVALGKAALERECATCHASPDGFDLAFFSYPDSTIIRRAVGHVDTATAQRIVAYIRSLNTPHVARTARIFQPGGRTVQNDVDFAMNLFGQDAWPTLTTAALRAIDPSKTPVALTFPLWSDELSNLDWLADSMPSPGILGFAGGRAANALTAYHASPTQANLLAAVAALRASDRDASNPAAPCLFNNQTRVEYLECFEVRRWGSSLVAQHMLRNGLTRSVGVEAAELWWDVGTPPRMAANKSNTSIANRTTNQIQWFYLGWIFEPGVHESFYLENLLAGNGMKRLAVFVALRGQVSRPPNSFDEHRSIYDDLRMAVRHAPNTWAYAAATFALNHCLERLNAGERPGTPGEKANSTTLIDQAMNEVAPKVTSAQLATLQNLANQVKARL